MPPLSLRTESNGQVARVLGKASAHAASAGRQFKVLLSSRAPAQLSLFAFGLPAHNVKGSRTG
jgi:hypothetical protein